MPTQPRDDSFAELFLGVYAELLLRGLWTPKLDDPELPGAVWIDFGEFESCARKARLKMPPAVMLLKAISHRAGKEITYPCALNSRPIPGRRSREHYVELHNPMNPWGAYAPLPEFFARRREVERAEFTREMQKEIDDTGCTMDLEEAVREHMEFWEEREVERMHEEFGKAAPVPRPGEARDDLVISAKR